MAETIETFEECPVCGDLFGVDQLAAHCEAHFEDPSQMAATQQPADVIACPVEGCQASIPAEDYEAHLFSHRCDMGLSCCWFAVSVSHSKDIVMLQCTR
jgi:hypothetical protein